MVAAHIAFLLDPGRSRKVWLVHENYHTMFMECYYVDQ